MAGGILQLIVSVLQLEIRGLSTFLHDDDIPNNLPGHLRANEDGVAAWITSEWARLAESSKRPSLVRLIWRLYWPDITVGMLCSAFSGLTSSLLRPLCLKFLIDAANDGDKDTAMALAGALSAIVVVEACFLTLSRVTLSDRLGCGMVSALGILVQRKALRIAPGAGGDTSERTLMSVDITKMRDDIMFIQLLPQSLVSLIVGTLTILYVVEYVGLFGLTMMFGTMLLNARLGIVAKKFEERRLKMADLRLGVTTRTISAMKVVKYNAWEDRFLADILKAREKEVAQLLGWRMLLFSNIQLGRVTPILSATVTYIMIVALGGDLNPGSVYSTLTVFQGLRLALVVFPMSTTVLATFRVHIDRIQGYLQLPEFSPSHAPDDPKLAASVHGATMRWPRPSPPEEAGKGAHAAAAAAPLAALKDADAAAASDGNADVPHAFSLSNVDLELKWGTSVALVGNVGAGKTSLLSALLGDLEIDTLITADLSSVGLVPQHAFIINGTVRENIVFGREWDRDVFDAAVRAAALDVDLAQIPNGEEAEIGERGVTLSGGQQQRVSLARAVYGCPRLLVMDDPLSAVDGEVAQHIFDRIVLGKDSVGHEADAGRLVPQGRVVLMVLNQFRFLHNFDHAVFLQRGRVVAQGPPAKLLEANDSFKEFVGGSIGEQDGAESTHHAGDTESEQGEANALTKEEARAAGKVSSSVYMRFIKGMGWWRVILVVLLASLAYGSMAFSDKWLAHWVTHSGDADGDVDTNFYAGIYAAGSLAFITFMMMEGLSVGLACAATSKSLHSDCIRHLMHAPVSFFESTPSGRLLSRFGADLSMVDGNLTSMTEASITMLFTLVVLSAVICIVAPMMLIVIGISAVIFSFQIVAQDCTTRQVKRMANNAMSPVLNCLGEIGDSHGKLLVRVMQFDQRYCRRFEETISKATQYHFVVTTTVTVGSFLSNLLAACISSSAAFIILHIDSASAAQLGLALTYCFLLPYYMQLLAQCLGNMNVGMTALERLLECCSDEVPKEPAWEQPGDAALVARKWPTAGAICFDHVSLVYRPGLPPAVKDCSFDIPGGSKVGVVGRTGAGKSSLFVLLFRLVDAQSGSVTIDGECVQDIGLLTLRRRMVIIPQEPLLLEGTLRGNVDPFGEHPAERVSEVLKRVGLHNRDDSEPRKLSAGERQLLQLARTLVRDVPIIVMDEPTSHIDPNTDRTMQTIIREHLWGHTIITIAHRLRTVIDADSILVMESGKVAEHGPPRELLEKRNGLFAAMVESEGPVLAQELRQRASLDKSAMQPEICKLGQELRQHAGCVSLQAWTRACKLGLLGQACIPWHGSA